MKVMADSWKRPDYSSEWKQMKNNYRGLSLGELRV